MFPTNLKQALGARQRYAWAVVVWIFVCVGLISQFYGENNFVSSDDDLFDSCLLENLGSVQTDSALRELRSICRKRYPLPKVEEVVAWVPSQVEMEGDRLPKGSQHWKVRVTVSEWQRNGSNLVAKLSPEVPKFHIATLYAFPPSSNKCHGTLAYPLTELLYNKYFPGAKQLSWMGILGHDGYIWFEGGLDLLDQGYCFGLYSNIITMPPTSETALKLAEDKAQIFRLAEYKAHLRK